MSKRACQVNRIGTEVWVDTCSFHCSAVFLTSKVGIVIKSNATNELVALDIKFITYVIVIIYVINFML